MVILVQVRALVQCSSDHSIGVECVTMVVLVWKCASVSPPPEGGGDPGPFISQGHDLTVGLVFYWIDERERERERDLLPGLSMWVLCRVMCSRTPGMVLFVTLTPVACPLLTSL
jgi:hypothetical protein